MTSVAIVTGSGRNLGRTIALTLASKGFDVVVNYRTGSESARGVAREAERLGASAKIVAADVSDPDQVDKMLGIAATMGDVRVLVNNAALRTPGAIDDLDLATWRAVQAVTLDGAFLCSRAALPHMRRRGGGRIVNVLGGNAWRGDPARVHLSAAKHGLWGLTLALAKACAEDGITVNAVSPTGLTRDDDEGLLGIQRNRIGEVVSYLASAEAAAVTGQMIELDCTHLHPEGTASEQEGP